MGFQHLNRASRQDRQDAVCHPSAFGTPAAFKLANDGHATRSLQHYLGHKNIQHTVRYEDCTTVLQHFNARIRFAMRKLGNVSETGALIFRLNCSRESARGPKGSAQ